MGQKNKFFDRFNLKASLSVRIEKKTLLQVVYLSCISVLGTACIAVTMMDKFSEAAYRPVRALLFVCLGLFGLVPTVHFLVQVESLGNISPLI